MARGVPAATACARFHEALADFASAVAARVGLPRVVLSGGCFQNALLTARIRARLEGAGFRVFCPRLVPPNDGGIALGQAWVARHVSRHSR